MGWADHYRRRDAIELVLATEGDRLPYAELDSVRAAFPSREDLALALQYRWTRALAGRLDVALLDAARFADVDHVGAVAAAWRATARRHPALRRLLDSYRAEAGPRFGAEVEANSARWHWPPGWPGPTNPPPRSPASAPPSWPWCGKPRRARPARRAAAARSSNCSGAWSPVPDRQPRFGPIRLNVEPCGSAQADMRP